MVFGLGFIFRPKSVARLAKSYHSRAQRVQKKLIKANRATGLFFILIGQVLLLSWFHPVWIYNCFVVARVIAGVLFPSMFVPAQTAAVIPTVWI